MNKEQIKVEYHVEYFEKGRWWGGWHVDTLKLAQERKENEKEFFEKVRIIKETRIELFEEIE